MVKPVPTVQLVHPERMAQPDGAETAEQTRCSAVCVAEAMARLVTREVKEDRALPAAMAVRGAS